MNCPLCNSRKAKRFCPAKNVQICSVCCATEREIEIDCPTSCTYLREGYHYTQEKSPAPITTEHRRPNRLFDRSFLVANEPFLMGIWQTLWESCKSVPQVHDVDVLAALEALEKTYRTLDKGLYYDSHPEAGVQQILYSDLKEMIDAKIQQPDAQQEHLKLSTVLDCLQFQHHFVRLKTSGRPLSRGFFMQLEKIFGESLKTSSSAGSRIVLA